MKKILEKTIGFTIGCFICVPINYFAFLHSWSQAFIIATSISIAYFIAIVLVEKVYPNLKTKNPFKRLWFWVRYKRVKEIKSGYCTGCFFDTNGKCTHPKEHIIKKCVINKQIFAKRSYNRLNWLKKLFAFIIIALIISSCVTVNVYQNEKTKVKEYKKEAQKLEQLESAWY